MTGDSERGFTLIEILVAMTVTLIALAGLVGLHATSIRSNRTAAHTARATSICERTLEDLRGMTVDRILDELGDDGWPIDTPLEPIEVGAISYRRRLTVDELDEDADLVLVRVEVAWTEAGATPGAERGRYDHLIALEVLRTKVDAL